MSLSISATGFVGREDELADIERLLANPACRLLTLVGPGGIGKTRLALEAARLFPGAQFVPLQPLTSPDFIVSAMADALGFQFYSGVDPKQQLIDYLREKSLLVVLDNFEHLLEGATLLSDMLASAPGLRTLVTSRERLHLVEEWVLDVGGLAYPARENEADAGHYSAVELFVQHARRVNAAFELGEAQRSAITRICRLVDGMPLGIELAASWVRALSCEAIADEIERSLDILETPTRNVEPRHRTMRAAFAPTWERLTDHERDVFMKLSVFRGGFTREAAEQVAGASLRTLSALVDRSLLRVDAEGRYDVHELLRQFAADKLHDSDTDTVVRYAHLYYFFNLAEALERRLFGPGQLISLERFEIEHDNLRSALAWALQRDDFDAGLRLVGALGWFWNRRTHWHEGRRWLETFLAAGRDASAPARGKALHHLMELSWEMGDRFYAEALCAEAVALAAELKDQWVKAWLLTSLGFVEPFQSGLGQGYLEEALALFRELGEQWGICEALNRLAGDLFDRGNFTRAGDLLEEGIRLARQAGDKSVLAFMLCSSATDHVYEDKISLQTEHIYRESLALFHELGYKHGIIWALLGLGIITHLAGEDERASKFFEHCLRISQEVGTSFYTMHCLMWLADIFCEDGETERGIRLYGAVSNLIKVYVASNSVMRKVDKARYDRWLAAARIRVGEVEFGATFAEGQRMTLDQAAAYAMEGRTMPTDTPVTEYANKPEAGSPGQADHTLLPQALTARELEILRLVADGLTNGEIADQLVLAKSTIKWYINGIFSKLDTNTRTQAVARARIQGLLH